MNRIPLLVIALLTLITAVPSSRAQLVTLAYDGFNYTVGSSLSGQNGGTGWTSAWVKDYPDGSDLTVSTGLAYTGLSTTGGSATWGSGSGNGISEGTRSLSLVNSGVVYIQFLGQFGSSSGGGTPNFRLYSSGAQTGAIGANGGSFGSVISILGPSDLQPLANGASSTSASLSSLNLIVTRIDYSANTTQMWVNPDLSTFNYFAPGTADATYANLAPAFDTISFFGSNPSTIDELKVFSVVPEPSTYAAMAGVAVLSFAAIQRRRKAKKA